MRKRLHVFVDFDGTITQQDSLEYILNKHVGPAWTAFEALVTRQKISEKEALQKEFNLLRLEMARALDDLEQVEIDPYFPKFANLCRIKNLQLTILSGGFDLFIRKILYANGLSNLTFHSNSVRVVDGRWTVIPARTPRLRNRCNHCKSNWLNLAKNNGEITIYIGDGNTDRCPAGKADIALAKGKLALFLKSQNKPLFPFNDFSDVLKIFETRILKSCILEQNHERQQYIMADR